MTKEQKAEGGRQGEVDRARLALVRLLTVFSPEQLEQVATAAESTRDNALIRQCSQSFEVEINDKGYVRFVHYRQSVPAVRPLNVQR